MVDWLEDDFIGRYGEMTVKEFIAKHMYSLDNWYQGYRNQTVRGLYEEILSQSISIRNTFLCGMDDQEIIVIIRKHDTFEVTTKPDGESRCWLEIGTEQEFSDELGNSHIKWIKHQLRYPQHDGRLDVKRFFQGEFIRWKISVALDYPLTIRLISRGPIIPIDFTDSKERTLWSPQVGVHTVDYSDDYSDL